MDKCIICKENKNVPIVNLPNYEVRVHIPCFLSLLFLNNKENNLFFYEINKKHREDLEIDIDEKTYIFERSELIAFIYELLTYYLPTGLTRKSTHIINSRFFPLLMKKTGIFNSDEIIKSNYQSTKPKIDYKNRNMKTKEQNIKSLTKDKFCKKNKIRNKKALRRKNDYKKMKPENKVVGQQEAKSLMLRLIHRFDQNQNINFDLIQNALFYGPTGTGKTLLLRTMCQKLDVNYYELDASSLTQSGYVGMSISEALTDFINKDGKESVENSIIYIDEIDKLASKSNFNSDVGTIAVQNELLKLLEGGQYQLQTRNDKGQSNNLVLKTNNIMFIASGSFHDIISLVKRRLMVDYSCSNKNITSIATDMSIGEIYNSISEKDLIKFGLKDEFLGRFEQKVPFYPLTNKEQCKVLKLENSVLDEYKELFKTLDIELSFENGAIEKLVSTNPYLETGCRGLKRHIREQLDKPYGLILESNINATHLIYKKNGNYIFTKEK
ncbi:MAG: AAA family ATPase [Bacillota bacterium]